MNSGKHTARTVVGVLLGVILAVTLAFEIVLNTGINKRVAARACDAFLDGADLQFSRLRVHLVPAVSLEMDSLAVTYPHEKFAAYDSVLAGMRISKVGCGRTEAVDTLLRFDNLSLRMRTGKLLFGKFDIRHAGIDALRLYAHKYDSNAVNWDVFKSSSKPKKEKKDSSALSLPKVSLGSLYLSGRTRISFVSHCDTLLAFAGLDTLGIAAEAADTSADVRIALDGRAFAFSPSFGRLRLPFSLDGDASLALGEKVKSVDIHSLEALVAEIPIEVSGMASSSDEGLYVDAGARIVECDLPSLVHNYVSKFVKGSDGILTSGNLSACAQARGMLSDGHKPEVKLALDADAHAILDSAYHFIPEGMSLGGEVDLRIEKPLELENGADISLVLDSLKFAKDTTLRVRVRGMENEARLSFVRMTPSSKAMPKLEFESKNSLVLLKTGVNRVALRNAGLKASVVKLSHSSRPRRRMLPPSDSIPDFLTEKDFEASDISISLDSGIVRLLSDYLPRLSLSLESASVSTPAFPLRTRVNGLEASVSSNTVDIGYAGISTGRSDLSVSGSVTGYRPLLMGRKGVVDMKLDVLSEHLNVNEVVAALQVGKEKKYVDSGLDQDESFVVDSLSSDAAPSGGMPLIVVPANVRADVNILAEDLKLAGVRVTPFEANIQMHERCLQLKKARLNTDVGEMEMDAFYSTRTKEKLSVGADLDMHNVSADGIISLLPSVDNMMPMLKSFKGNMDASLSATAALDTNMNVRMPTLDAIFKISGQDLTVEDAGGLRKITRLLLFRNPDIGTIDDLTVGGVVHDSRIEVFPFVLGVDRYTIALSGVQGFGGSMDYHASILKSPLLFRFGINVFGSTDKLRFRFGLPAYNPSLAPSYTRQIDSIQFNLANSIRDVYRRGADGVARQARLDRETLRARIQADSLENSRLVLLDSTARGFNPDSLESMIKLALEPDSVRVDSSAAVAPVSPVRGPERQAEKSTGNERLDRLKKKSTEHKDADRKAAAALRSRATKKK
ncbi:MAG: hypothetical protein MJY43_05940 [Bacteroidales bacterium]|nr:hypothetical protein [Bacteroidales bacterium]